MTCSRLAPVVAVLILLAALTGVAGADDDVVILGGRAYTADAERTFAEAVAITDGVITYVGSDAGVRERIGAGTRVLNARGGSVLPGLHDVHLHPLEAGSAAVSCVLSRNGSVDRWMRKVRRCARRQDVAGEWLLGAGFSISALIEDGRDPATALDAVSRGRPVVLLDDTSHAAWANTRALELMGYTAQTEDAPGGHIARREDGSPSGILLDTANDMVFHRALGTPTERLRRANAAGLRWALKQIAKNGITSIGNARVYWKRGNLETWRDVRDAGDLTARTTLALWAYPEDTDDGAQIAALAAMRNDDDPSLRVTQVKMYADGIPINTTAAMLEPYVGDLGVGLASTRGLSYFDEDRLTTYVAGLEAAGFDLHIHAIGDRGVRESLNAVERTIALNGGLAADRRHRLTHVEYVHAADLPRFAALNVIADAQMACECSLPGQEDAAEAALVGAERLAARVPLRSLYDAGARITLSSDWDVAALSPFVGMEHALDRGAESLPSLAAVLDAYTIDAAYALRQEHLVGSLEVGKRGDVTIVDRDLFAVSTRSIGRAKVRWTVLEGAVVYRRRGRRRR